MSIVCTLQLTVCLLILAFNANVRSDIDFTFDVAPWEYYNYGPVSRRGVWYPWSEFYFLPSYRWGPPRARAFDPPDQPDPVSRGRKQQKGQQKVKKRGRKKNVLKKRKRPRANVEEQEESEGQRPRPRKLRRKLRKRKRQNNVPK